MEGLLLRKPPQMRRDVTRRDGRGIMAHEDQWCGTTVVRPRGDGGLIIGQVVAAVRLATEDSEAIYRVAFVDGSDACLPVSEIRLWASVNGDGRQVGPAAASQFAPRRNIPAEAFSTRHCAEGSSRSPVQPCYRSGWSSLSASTPRQHAATLSRLTSARFFVHRALSTTGSCLFILGGLLVLALQAGLSRALSAAVSVASIFVGLVVFALHTLLSSTGVCASLAGRCIATFSDSRMMDTRTRSHILVSGVPPVSNGRSLRQRICGAFPGIVCSLASHGYYCLTRCGVTIVGIAINLVEMLGPLLGKVLGFMVRCGCSQAEHFNTRVFADEYGFSAAPQIYCPQSGRNGSMAHHGKCLPSQLLTFPCMVVMRCVATDRKSVV